MSQVMTRTSRAFRGRVLGKVRQTEGEDGPLGEADIMVAVFDIPDTDPAVGNTKRQVIDKGAFQGWIQGREASQPVLFLRDHGNAHMTGFVDSSLTLGFGDNFREGEEDGQSGLIYTAHYNLATQEGADAFERLRFSPATTQFSFRWDEDTVEDGEDGFEHVTEFRNVEEVSQVGFGAQSLTKPLGWRTAVASHETGTSESSWDGPANEAKLASDASPETLRSAFAWQDPDGDPEAKSTYKFIHHEVGDDGAVGAANMTAASSAIAVLNGGRGGTTIPDGDRQGVYNHLAKHLRDGDKEPPELRTEEAEDEGAEGGSGERAAESLDQLSGAVRAAFDAAHPSTNEPDDDGWTLPEHWVHEVWSDEDLRSGFVVVYTLASNDFSKVPWTRTEQGFEFNDEAAEPVHQVWQTLGGEALSAGEAVRAGGEHDPLPSRSTVREWVKHESFRKMVQEELDNFRSDDSEEGDRAAEGEDTDARSVASAELRALYSTLYQRT